MSDPIFNGPSGNSVPPSWSGEYGFGLPGTHSGILPQAPNDGSKPDAPLPAPGGITVELRPNAHAPSEKPSELLERSLPVLESGRFLVGEALGQGGVGIVYEGWEALLDREVAVKILREEHRDKPDIVRRFLEEARITSRLQHPGVVAVHDMGLCPDHRPYFAMQRVRGETLERVLRSREDPSKDLALLLGIFVQICQAVAYAHHLGIIHRDLKPDNIMVGDFGVVKVMDWGLAKALNDPDLPDAIAAATAVGEFKQQLADAPPTSLPSGTILGTIFGTPAYLPPEQARGEIDHVDKRADVFGLGSILCEILTGQPPYAGADAWEIYYKAAGANLADAFERLNACPAAIDLLSLAKWCLAPDRDDRPIDAAEVTEVMMAYMQSDQRRAELDLVRFFDLSLDLFCIASTDGYFLRVNKNFPAVLGYSVLELTSRPFIEFVHPADRAKTLEECARVALGSPCVQFVNHYRHADGHYLCFEWNARSIPEERAIYAVARNLTGRIGTTDGDCDFDWLGGRAYISRHAADEIPSMLGCA